MQNSFARYFLFLRCTLVVFLTFAMLLTDSAFGQAYKESTGFNKLLAEVGPTLENGAGIRVGTVEARVGVTQTSLGSYLINTSDPQFAGKTIIDGSGLTSGNSGHANGVAIRQFGNSSSFSPGVTQITNYEANDWIGRVLGFNAGVAPEAQPFQVMNHSYIGNGLTTAQAVELNRRIDFLAERDNITQVVGTNNGGTNPVPQIFSQSYNTIVVGRSDGAHAHGNATLNGAGRIKPDIVAPETSVSNSAPLVASAATLLRQRGINLGNPDATRNEITKAVLLAGATKQEFPTWENTTTRPLDDRFGAGELNVYNSYTILSGGEFDGSLAEPTTVADDFGWDYGENIAVGEEFFYTFNVDSIATDASFLLTWNAQISDAGGILDYDTLNLANLDLRLYDSTTTFRSAIIGESLSTVDNVEHLYFSTLASGTYTLAVSSVSGPITDFGLAWRLTAVPEPNAGMMLAMLATIGLCSQRRSRPKESKIADLAN